MRSSSSYIPATMKNIVLSKIVLVVVVLLLVSTTTQAQSIQGTTNVITNVEYTYTYSDGNTYDDVSWTITNGTVEMYYLSTGTTYVANVIWTSTGTGILKIFNSYGDQLAATNVTITACTISAPTITASTFERCGAGTLTLQGASGSGGNTLRWYSTSTGATLLATGTTYTTPSLNSATTYYYTSYNSTTGCESTTRSSYPVTIKAVPDLYSNFSGGITPRCGPGSVTLYGTSTDANEYAVWYTSATGGAAATGGYIGVGSTSTTTVSSTTTFYATLVNNLNGCETPNRVGIIATVNPKPNITASGNGQAICSGSGSAITLSSDQANTTYTYYHEGSNVTGLSSGSQSTTGTSLSHTFSVTNGNSTGTATYYISGVTYFGTSTACQGPQQTVVVNVNPVPALGLVNNAANICSGQPTSITLSNPNNVSGTVYSWTVSPTNVSGASAVSNTSAGAIAQSLTTTTATASGLVNYSVTPSFTANGKNMFRNRTEYHCECETGAGGHRDRYANHLCRQRYRSGHYFKHCLHYV